MKTHYVINPDADINSLCVSMLDESSFHQLITVVGSDKKKTPYSAWEVTPKQLREIYQSAKDKGIPLARFQVVVSRVRSNESPRIAQKKEYIKGYQSIRKRPERLNEILAQKKSHDK